MDYMLATLTELVADYRCIRKTCWKNLAITKGLYFSQTILLELTRRGLERKTAYEAVQRAAMATWQGENDFLTEVRKFPEITSVIPPADLEKLCSLEQHFRYIDQVLLGKRDCGTFYVNSVSYSVRES